MVRHTVVFKLKAQTASQEEYDFFGALQELALLPGVKKFECLRQISRENNFDFGLSMEFDDATLYEQYSNHPVHVRFVQEYWIKEVENFLEIDYEPLA